MREVMIIFSLFIVGTTFVYTAVLYIGAQHPTLKKVSLIIMSVCFGLFLLGMGTMALM